MAITASASSASPSAPGVAVPRAFVVAAVTLFFIWGGLTSLNDILIPKLKGLFALSYAEAMLTQFAFFTAYAVVSLPAGQLVARVGYVHGIVIGLGTMAVGCLAFVPASASGIYATFLAALFVVAAGITVLQVAANPLIASLGSAATSPSRLTLAQAFNSLGTTIFPPVGALLILGSSAARDTATMVAPLTVAQEAAVIGRAYVAIAAVLAAVALFFWTRRHQLPVTRDATTDYGGAMRLLARPRLAGGVASIFFYVGAEVAIGSMLVNYLAQPSVLGLSQQDAGARLALYWGGAMAGRFVGAGLLRVVAPGLVLMGAAIGAALLTAFSGASTGAVAGYTLLAVGLMNSVMFPTIFSLGVEGLGGDAPRGSGLLCMAIVGGAVVPLAFGVLADRASLSAALALPVICYALIAAYGWSSRRPVA